MIGKSCYMLHQDPTTMGEAFDAYLHRNACRHAAVLAASGGDKCDLYRQCMSDVLKTAEWDCNGEPAWMRGARQSSCSYGKPVWISDKAQEYHDTCPFDEV